MELAKSLEIQGALIEAIKNKDAGLLGSIDAQLETLEHHARKVKDNTGKLREIIILRIWTLYELGMILNEIAPHGGPRYQGGNLDNTLVSMGISPKLSARARKLAAIHKEDIRTFIEESGDEINISYLLRLGTEEATEPSTRDDDAEWMIVLSVVTDYYENGTNEERRNRCAEFLKER